MKVPWKQLPLWARIAIGALWLVTFAATALITAASAGIAEDLLDRFGLWPPLAVAAIAFAGLIWIASRLDE